MESRKRLYHWMKRNVEEENFGLKWMNREQQLFRIPWANKHSRSWNKVNCQVFKEWAKVTNRYREGEPEDWPGWKTRLRTALTKLPYFEEVHEMHKLDDSDNAYKVYRFVDKKKSRQFAEASPSNACSPSSSQEAHSSPDVTPSHAYYDALSPNFDERLLGKTNQALIAPKPVEESFLWNIPPSTPSQFFDVEIKDESSKSQNLGSLSSDLQTLKSDELMLCEKLPSTEMNQYKNEPVIEYSIYYLDEIVKKGVISDAGVHFHFQHIFNPSLYNNTENVFGPNHLERIQFPDINIMKRSITSEQQQHLQDILLKLDRGFTLEFDDAGSMYARRLCRTRIFASSFSIGSESLLLDRRSKERARLFDITEFKKNPSDSPTTMLTFAQYFKRFESLSKILMRMELTHIRAKDIQKSYAPPGPEGDLQFSNLDSGDLMLHQMQTLSLGPKH